MKRLLSLIQLVMLVALAVFVFAPSAFAAVGLPAPIASLSDSSQAIVTKIVLALLAVVYTIARSIRKTAQGGVAGAPVEPGYTTTEFWVTVLTAAKLMYGLATTGS